MLSGSMPSLSCFLLCELSLPPHIIFFSLFYLSLQHISRTSVSFSFPHAIASCTTFSISFFVPITGPQAFDGILISVAVHYIVGVSLGCYCSFDYEIKIGFQALGYLSWDFLILQFYM